MKLSDKQIAGAAQGAGFAGADLAIAVAVALAESGGNASASHANMNGSVDYGLWQINSIHKQILSSGRWDDPNSNAKMARQVFHDAGNKWRPWVTYNTQAYRIYMGRATVAAGQPASNLPAPSSPSSPSLPDVGGIVDTLKFLTDARNWRRLGMFLAGLAFATFGLWGIVKDTRAGEAAISAAKTAAKTAKTAAEVAAIA